MTKTFSFQDRTFTIRDRDDGQILTIEVFEGEKKLFTLELPLETLSDSEGVLGDLATFVESDFKRLVDEGLLVI